MASIDRLKKQAKNLQRHLPEFIQEHQSNPPLAACQELIAKSYGYPSWHIAVTKLNQLHENQSAIDSPRDIEAPDARVDAALQFFAPELARILAQQIHIFDRATVNFSCASAKNGVQPNDHWSTFKPWKPSLFPSAPAFQDMKAADSALLAEFYDSLSGIDDLIRTWRESEILWDVNVWNYLMQTIQNSVKLGAKAVERFCPGRQYNPTMPASGTLLERATKSSEHMKSALDAHIQRFQLQAELAKPILGPTPPHPRLRTV